MTFAPTSQETLSLARAIYERDLRRDLENSHEGKMIAIEVNSGEYELGVDSLKALDALQARLPRGRFCVFRIGAPTRAPFSLGQRRTAS